MPRVFGPDQLPNPAQPTFYERHQAALARLFDVLAMPPEAAASLDAAVEATQPWARGDHSRPEHAFAMSDEQSLAAHGLYEVFGLKQAWPLPPGQYDQALVFGALQRGNNRRLAFLRDTLDTGELSVGRIMLLSGERRVSTETELPEIKENLHDIERQKSGNAWTKQLDVDKVASWWETDLVRLAATAQLGPLIPRNVRYHPQASNNDYPERYEFEWRDIPLTLSHTLAVQGQDEPSRATEARVADWLRVAAPPESAKIAVISANPQLERMGKTTRAILRAHGREDLDVVVAGPRAAHGLGHALYLGEIARNLYEDQRAANV